jgi:hypothetical protein
MRWKTEYEVSSAPNGLVPRPWLPAPSLLPNYQDWGESPTARDGLILGPEGADAPKAWLQG